MFVRAKKSGPYQYLQVKVISLYEKERQTRLTQLKNLLSAVGKSADRFDLFRSSQPIV